MARNYRDRTAVLTQSDGARWTFTTVEHIPDPTHYILSDVAGWYGGSGVRRTSTARYGHGNFLGPGFREGRTMTLHAGIRCDSSDERDWQERNLSGTLWDGDTGTLWYDDGQTQLTSHVALDGAPQIVKSGTRNLVIQVPLVSESPFLYGEWREVTIHPPGAGHGFDFPPFGKEVGGVPAITFGDEIKSNALVWNEGNADSWATFTAWTNSPSGFAVGLGGHRVTYPWPTFSNVPITIDMEGAVLASGTDQTHMVGERDWAPIRPGEIAKPYFELLGGGGGGFCTVAFRDTYI